MSSTLSTSDDYDYSSVPVSYEYREGFTADLQPKRLDEIKSAAFMRLYGSTPGFASEVLAKRRPEAAVATWIVPEFLSYALLAGTSTGLQLFTSVDRLGSTHAPYLTSAIEIAKREMPGFQVTGFVLANAFIGVALRVAKAGGMPVEVVEYEALTYLQLGSNLARKLLPTVKLRAAYTAVDLCSWRQEDDALFYPSKFIIATTPIRTPAEKPSSAATVVPAVLQISAANTTMAVPVADLAFGSTTVAEGASIATLLDLFESSRAAPSSKPHLTRPTIRILLHELDLTEQASVTELRSALKSADESFPGKVARRSELYGMTARMGRAFNNPVASPADCLAQAKDAKKRKSPGWQRLTAEQKRDRYTRWTAWLAFIGSADFEEGPLPVVQW